MEAAANIFRELCYNYRDSLMAGIIVAGWDKRKGGQVHTMLCFQFFIQCEWEENKNK